jgi:hypothetical protein
MLYATTPCRCPEYIPPGGFLHRFQHGFRYVRSWEAYGSNYVTSY